MTAESIRDTFKMSQMSEKDSVQILLEEDILVPDSKPDLSKIVSIEGKMNVIDKETDSSGTQISGKIDVKLMYIPMAETDDFPLIPMDAVINFKHELDYPVSDKSEVEVAGNVEHMDFEIVNERKLRVKTVTNITSRVYDTLNVDLFSNSEDEEMQLLKSEAMYTDIVEKKKAPIDIREELSVKEGMPEIGKILNWDINIIENQRQLVKDRVVVNAEIQYNILYLSEEVESVPVLFREKSEFTQFIDVKEDDGTADSKVEFILKYSDIKVKNDANDNMTIFDVYVDIMTNVEISKTKVKEFIVDAYNPQKQIEAQKDKIQCKLMSDKSAADVSIKELLNIPDNLPDMERIIYITGKAFETGSVVEHGRDIIEGILSSNILYVSNEGNRKTYGFNEEIPFRHAVEIAGLSSEKTIEHDITVRRLDFEMINSKQIEINASLYVKSTSYKKDTYEVLTDVLTIDADVSIEENPSIILYVTKKGDSLWKIAKNYRTTIEEIKTINNMLEGSDIKPGEKLILLKNCQ